MMSFRHGGALRNSKAAWLAHDSGAQLVEFAVALPLLVVFVVGIFDFSTAFTLKQRLTNVARDAARISAADPANDLGAPSGAQPGSVLESFQAIDNYFLTGNLNDCGVALSGPGSGLTWTYSGNSNGCPSPGLTIIINRGYYFPPGAAAPNVNCQSQTPNGQMLTVATCVSIQYAYAWRFGRAASLLGARTVLPTQISAVAVAMNEN
jgi:TadE-like protein